jgi:hypothetical protein
MRNGFARVQSSSRIPDKWFRVVVLVKDGVVVNYPSLLAGAVESIGSQES